MLKYPCNTEFSYNAYKCVSLTCMINSDTIYYKYYFEITLRNNIENSITYHFYDKHKEYCFPTLFMNLSQFAVSKDWLYNHIICL